MKHYRQDCRRRRLMPFARAAGVVAAVMIIVSGVTFAALQSQQAKLTSNTIQTTTASLQLSADNVNYGATQPGFSFANLVPGGQALPTDGYAVFLKNTGGTPLALKLFVGSTPTNLEGVDLTKVHVILTPTNGGSIQNFTLQALVAAASTGGLTILAPSQLTTGASVQYKLQASMESDAMSGPGATIGNIDFSFNGSAVTQ